MMRENCNGISSQEIPEEYSGAVNDFTNEISEHFDSSSICLKRQHSSDEFNHSNLNDNELPEASIKISQFERSIRFAVSGLLEHFRLYNRNIEELKAENDILHFRLMKLENSMQSVNSKFDRKLQLLTDSSSIEDTRLCSSPLHPPSPKSNSPVSTVWCPIEIVSLTQMYNEQDGNSTSVINFLTEPKDAPTEVQSFNPPKFSSSQPYLPTTCLSNTDELSLSTPFPNYQTEYPAGAPGTLLQEPLNSIQSNSHPCFTESIVAEPHSDICYTPTFHEAPLLTPADDLQMNNSPPTSDMRIEKESVPVMSQSSQFSIFDLAQSNSPTGCSPTNKEIGSPTTEANSQITITSSSPIMPTETSSKRPEYDTSDFHSPFPSLPPVKEICSSRGPDNKQAACSSFLTDFSTKTNEPPARRKLSFRVPKSNLDKNPPPLYTNVIDLTTEVITLPPFSTASSPDFLPRSISINSSTKIDSKRNLKMEPKKYPISKMPSRTNNSFRHNNFAQKANLDRAKVNSSSISTRIPKYLAPLDLDAPKCTDIAPLPQIYPSTLPTLVSNGAVINRIQSPPILVIFPAVEGVSLRWEILPSSYEFEPAIFYELYSYASSDVDEFALLTPDIWQKVGDIEALPLPMICTLTSIISNNIYYFTVRSRDKFGRISEWSNVVTANVL